MCTAVNVKNKKKRSYDAEHSCIARQCVTEYSEKMGVSVEQRCTNKFCVSLKKMLSETTELLKEVFGKEMLCDLTIQQWHKAIVDRWESAKFKPRGSVPWTVVTATNINTVATVIEQDRHLTVQALAEALHIPRDTKGKDNESVTDDE